MGRMNKLWHERNRMPGRATLDQRIRWHRAHAKHCACRPMPAGIVQAIESGEARKPRTRSSPRA
jgi:hypothetical protein